MDSRRALTALGAVAAVLAAGPAAPAGAAKPSHPPQVRELATFAAPDCDAAANGGCGQGSTVGPDKALYVTDGPGGRVLRIDPRTGAVSTFASGLPRKNPGPPIGAATDVVFAGRTAYVLVSLVGPFFGQPDVVGGLYRIGRNGAATPIADLGAYSIAHPPATPFFVTSGVQYAVERYHGGFVVTDGHHNRVLRVTERGRISVLRAFGNIVPTGLEVRGGALYMARAGAIPHPASEGRILRIAPWWATAEVASGAALAVDVEFGHDGRLYALSQGDWDLPQVPANEGRPASPNTGALMRVGHGGGVTPVVSGLDRPTSVEFIGHSAFVVTYTGKVLRIDGVAR
jgi:sugar lactone lactonase YvrE